MRAIWDVTLIKINLGEKFSDKTKLLIDLVVMDYRVQQLCALPLKSRCSPFCIATRLRVVQARNQCLFSQQGQGIFVFSTALRPALYTMNIRG
jgi:hypothetical protein